MQDPSEVVSNLEQTSNTLKFALYAVPFIAAVVLFGLNHWKSRIDRKIDQAKAQISAGKDALIANQGNRLQAAGAQLTELQAWNADRIILPGTVLPHTLDGLYLFKGTKIIIEPINEEEPKETARQIADAVRAAGWDVVEAIPRKMSIPAGVYIQSSTPNYPASGRMPDDIDPDYCKHQLARQAADALFKVLASDNKWFGVETNLSAGQFVPVEDRIPAGSVRILVGVKKANIRFNPQFQAMERLEDEVAEQAGRDKAAGAMAANSPTTK